MGTTENKAVVRRFWDELIIGGNLEVADELLAPNYVNLIVEGLADTQSPGPTSESGDAGGDDVARLKEAVTAYLAGVKELRFDVVDMAAEGDAVFARLNNTVTLPDGSTTTARALVYYRLVDGKIVLNDVMSVPT